MSEVLLVIHILIALALIGTVMLQRNEGGGLGIGGGSGGGGGMGGFMTGRGTANLLTRTTAILAGLFMISSLVLVILMNSQQPAGSLVDQLRDTGTPGVSGESQPQTDPVPQVE